MYKIGVVGFSGQKFDEEEGKSLLIEALNQAVKNARKDNGFSVKFEIVSGLTNAGIPKLAYQIAKVSRWPTAGVACSKAQEYDCFPCDRVQIVGDEWGDESKTFTDQLDAFIRIGGGNQSIAETETAYLRKIPVYECDLSALPKAS